MAHNWLRLWHDMPNDPKWRTIARVSGQSIATVMAVYLHLMVNASANATERGRTHAFCSEDVASALDVDTDVVDRILSAMQGRVLDGDVLLGWKKRQVEREDGSAARAKAWREAKKAEKTAERTQPNATERKKTPDTDTDTDIEGDKSPSSAANALPTCPIDELIDLYEQNLPLLAKPRRSLFKRGAGATAMRARWRWVCSERYESGDRAGQRMAESAGDGLAWFGRFFGYVAQSDWLSGRDKGWKCGLDWLMKAENFAKVLAGNYHQEVGA